MQKLNMSRRNWLKGVGLSATGSVLASMGWQAASVMAQTTPTTMDTLAFYRFSVGDFQVTAISDGTLAIDNSVLAVNAPEELAAFLDANYLPTTAANVAINLMLIDTGEQRILIDAGAGSFTLGAEPNGGKIVATLNMLGLQAGDIDMVVISHFHPDHLGGVTDDDGNIVFPNAEHKLSVAETAFMTEALQADEVNPFVAFAESKLAPLRDNGQLTSYEAGEDLVPGIQSVAAPGHTLGHTNFLISSGSERILNLIDTASNPIVAMSHPDWIFGFDSVPEQAIETRRAVFQRASDERLLLFGYHFAFPGIGYAIADGDVWRFVPTG